MVSHKIWINIHLCMLYPNCTRNHAITYTNKNNRMMSNTTILTSLFWIPDVYMTVHWLAQRFFTLANSYHPNFPTHKSSHNNGCYAPLLNLLTQLTRPLQTNLFHAIDQIPINTNQWLLIPIEYQCLLYRFDMLMINSFIHCIGYLPSPRGVPRGWVWGM
jgi:hypothetical protein